MKRIALVVAALGLSAGAAVAATPGNSAAMNRPARSQVQLRQGSTPMATAQRSNWRANQETKALNLLEAQGFTSFTDFRPAGSDQYAANVMQHGHDVTVRVNPQDGQISRG